MTYSVNPGIPIVVSHSQSWVAQSVLKLAAYVAGDKVPTISLAPDGKGSKSKDQPDSAAKERRGLLRFVRHEA